MLVLNPEHLQATRDPLLPKQGFVPAYVAIVRVVLATLAAVAAVAIGYTVTSYLANALPSWVVIVAVGAFVYLASLTTMVVEGIRWQAPIAVLWGAAFALALPWRSGPEAFALGGIMAVSAVLAYLAYRSVEASFLSLHTFSVIHRYASVVATGTIVALIVLYGAAVSRGSALLPQGILSSAADAAARVVPTFIPNLTPASSSTISVYDLALASARSQLSDDVRYRALGPAEQAKVLAEAARLAAESFSKQFGSVSASSSIGTVAQNAATTLLDGFRNRYGWYFTIAWLLGAFFIARSAAVILTFAVTFLAWATVSAGISLGLLRVQSMPAVRERITF